MFHHEIKEFKKTVGMLPDQPNMEPQLLKDWFDAAPEELRQALSGVCADGAVLEGKVNGIIERTFAGNVSESMLDDALAGKLNSKAEQAALDAEQAARTDADSALDRRVQTAEGKLTAQQTAIAAKCEIVCGVYTGNSNGTGSQTINLGFYPLAVLISCPTTSYGDDRTAHNLALRNYPANCAAVTSNGFQVSGMFNTALAWRYIAFKG